MSSQLHALSAIVATCCQAVLSLIIWYDSVLQDAHEQSISDLGLDVQSQNFMMVRMESSIANACKLGILMIQ